MSTLEELERRNPQWRPWLAVMREVLLQIDDRTWDAAVPQQRGIPEPGRPLLEGSSSFAHEELERLRRKLANMFCPPAALDAVLCMPLLHACRRRWGGAIPRDWSRGYCPLCGAWPAFAEMCGVERSRYLRCAGCGSAWRANLLTCPHCNSTDHGKLVSLQVEGARAPTAIEACAVCLGYLKVFTRLQPVAPSQVVLEDLGSVELDIAAVHRGYRRPPERHMQ